RRRHRLVRSIGGTNSTTCGSRLARNLTNIVDSCPRRTSVRWRRNADRAAPPMMTYGFKWATLMTLSSNARCLSSMRHGVPPMYLLVDPDIRSLEAFLERDRRLPAEHFSQPGIVRIAATDTLRSRNVLLRHANAGDLRDDVDQFVDG